MAINNHEVAIIGVLSMKGILNMGTAKKLYYEDAYMSQFSATVTSCTETKYNGRTAYDVTLSQTAFFPEEGGQDCDTGKIIACVDFMDVLRVYIHDDEIHHIIEDPVIVGNSVTGIVDFDARYDKMQQHSGEHILCGIIYRKYGLDNVGFHLGSDVVTFDINGTFTDEEITEIEKEANFIVFSNIECKTYFPNEAELETICYRSKFDDEEPKEGVKDISKRIAKPRNIRLVEFPGVDICACCAPHVSRTGEIGMIKLIASEHFRGGTRFTLMCGMRALDEMRRLEQDAASIMHLLSAKPSEVGNSVIKLKADLDSTRLKLYERDKKMASMLADKVRSEQIPIIFCDDMNQDIARETINGLCASSGREFCYFFIGSENKYRFIIGSNKSDCRAQLKNLSQELDIKGGGSNTMVMGTVCSDESHIRHSIERCSLIGRKATVILASSSPRRKEILSRTHIPFYVIPSGISENIVEPNPKSLVKRLSKLKAADVLARIREDGIHNDTLIVIGSDTVVAVDNDILGKPVDTEDAVRMIGMLSGRSHDVHTGVTILVAKPEEEILVHNFCVTSKVNVKAMTEEAIRAYVATGEPFDKAGGYAIQGLFAPYIDGIEGDYYNIVGFPIAPVYEILSEYCLADD